MSLSFVLHAKNSSGHQRLEIERDSDGTYGLYLVGTYDGSPIQIDFDSLEDRDLDDLAAFIAIRRLTPSSAHQEQPQ